MAASGLTLFILFVLRIILDVQGYAPMPDANKWRWGLMGIVASVLMILSLIVAAWRLLP